MNTAEPTPAIAVLDDYQNVALEMADWTRVKERAAITVFNDHLADPEAVASRLAPFDILCVMRERTPLPRAMLERLPRLKLIVTTGRRNASIDVAAASERGIVVAHTGYSSAPTIEFAFALILASVRNIASENASLHAGGWQRSLGGSLRGATLGVMGLGNIGAEIARLGLAFGMKIIAWSQNLTAERTAAAGATLVSKTALFEQADILSIHLVLSTRTRGLIGAQELALMKPTARLVNSSRGPIVDEAALIAALREGKIAGAAIDVFDCEPLPQDHPFRTLANVLATPHIGYVSEDMYRVFYRDTVENIIAYLDGRPPPFLLTPGG
ncbi:D-2-hydroxyacid dehydrogenase family protein [Methylocella silvestris]|uniref:Hydroxyacid dehydrogenase n=1 Tax=Methylocella silvestris TaxID=199596 RepID=A0A2J7TKQ0_METSI|nr:D-2-hydroxyacid dehydrogenase family protein [Methylocella silvestris]PNG27350.1 hydroxyacid dehydrogenase [Methylocella silvestris]